MTTTAAGYGWYLYGITRSGPLATVLGDAVAGPIGNDITVASDAAAPLQLLDWDELAAVVRPVPLADFHQAALQERVRNASDLEAIVRSHNRVIEAIHARQPILPAKFGMVYTHAADIVSGLQSASDTLLPQLRGLEGCDEWAVHLYADYAAVRDRIAMEDPAIRLLRNEFALARPGRAYFLERQLRGELEAGTRQALVTLAQGVFENLSCCAIIGQLNAAGPVDDAIGEVEILKASFLVARDSVDRFAAEVRSVADAGDGLRCESTGPWPPYSFAARDDERAA